MCGRFNLRATPAQIAEFFDLVREPELAPRYNIAPTQPVAAVRLDEAGEREFTRLHWGLIPSWSKDAKGAGRMINARSETAATKPAFRAAFKRRRCLIPASGFYEWQQTGAKTKQPYHVHLPGDALFAFAGLWEHWSDEEGGEIESATILTCEANDALAELHDRMPVILPREHHAVWLDHDVEDRDALQSLLVPYPSDELQADPVSTLVNSPRNETPDVLEAGGERSLFE